MRHKWIFLFLAAGVFLRRRIEPTPITRLRRPINPTRRSSWRARLLRSCSGIRTLSFGGGA